VNFDKLIGGRSVCSLLLERESAIANTVILLVRLWPVAIHVQCLHRSEIQVGSIKAIDPTGGET
jgi:hypothetical protein